MRRHVYGTSAPSSTLTSSTTETQLAAYTIPGNAAVAGKVYEFDGFVAVPSTNSTDTLRVRVRVGTTTLTGTAVLDSGAVDVADDDICYFSGKIKFNGETSSESVPAFGCIVLDAAGTAVGADGEILSAVDATADLLVEVTAVWSVSHADNQCALQAFDVYESVAA